MTDTFDPLSFDEGYRDGLADLRDRCPVSRSPSGPWYLATYDQVEGATHDIATFLASFRAPGVVVPAEEQFKRWADAVPANAASTAAPTSERTNSRLFWLMVYFLLWLSATRWPRG